MRCHHQLKTKHYEKKTAFAVFFSSAPSKLNKEQSKETNNKTKFGQALDLLVLPS